MEVKIDKYTDDTVAVLVRKSKRFIFIPCLRIGVLSSIAFTRKRFSTIHFLPPVQTLVATLSRHNCLPGLIKLHFLYGCVQEIVEVEVPCQRRLLMRKGSL